MTQSIKLNWQKAESLECPKSYDITLSETTTYVRRKIEKVDVEGTDNQEAYTKYVYEEAKFVEQAGEIRGAEDPEEYLTELLRLSTLQENETALASKKFITTSIGDFSIKTPTYDFIFCLMALKDLPTGVAEGTIRFYNGLPCPALSQQEIITLYGEVCTAIMTLDALFTNNKKAIETATLDDLLNLNFVY